MTDRPIHFLSRLQQQPAGLPGARADLRNQLDEATAAACGEFDPVDANDSKGGRSRNWRTEITLQPNIDAIVAVPAGS